MREHADDEEPPDRRTLERIATESARRAGRLIRGQIGAADRVGSKSSPTDVVTQTDLDAEALIRDELLAATPAAGMLGEEGGASSNPRARLQWIVDPLDGTVNFLYSLPVIAVSIGAAVDGEIVAGAVVDVVREETFSASAGAGARVDGDAITVSSCVDLSAALVATGFSYGAARRAEQGAIVRDVLPAARDVRCFGSAALQLCWVGCGRVDGYYERDRELWDYAAGSLIAAEAGATVELPCPENGGLVLVATPAVYAPLRAAVAPH